MALLALVFCQPVFAQAPVAPKPTDPKPTDPIAEVEINAQREKLYVLRKELVKLEDQFYAKYNEINTNNQFDVHCRMERRTGTNLSARVCTPVFVDNATEDEARAFLEGRTITPASMVILEKTPAYKKNLLDVSKANPELRKVLMEIDTLQKRYEVVRKKKFKGKVIVFE